MGIRKIDGPLYVLSCEHGSCDSHVCYTKADAEHEVGVARMAMGVGWTFRDFAWLCPACTETEVAAARRC